MTFLSQLDWRFATKLFDASKTVPEEQFQKILHAIHMAPTSFGLQPFHVFIVRDEDVKQKISQAAFGQPQPKDAPVTLVFCADSDVSAKINTYIETASGGDAAIKESMSSLRDMVNQGIGSASEEQRFAWAAKQAYIALGFGMAACAELGIDSCPMEGFNPQVVDETLRLPTHLRSIALLSIGFRAAEPTRKKVRLTDTELFS